MTKLYYSALDALWMMERHGMTFDRTVARHREDCLPLGAKRGDLIYDKAVDDIFQARYAINLEFERPRMFEGRFYPDAAGLALLVPRVGDIVKQGKMSGVVVGQHYFAIYVEDTAEYEIRIESDIRILERNNIPFIMPQEE